MSLNAAVRAFGRFWWEFLFGDTPELAVGVGLALGAGWALAAVHLALVAALLPLAVLLLLVASVWRGRAPG